MACTPALGPQLSFRKQNDKAWGGGAGSRDQFRCVLSPCMARAAPENLGTQTHTHTCTHTWAKSI